MEAAAIEGEANDEYIWRMPGKFHGDEGSVWTENDGKDYPFSRCYVSRAQRKLLPDHVHAQKMLISKDPESGDGEAVARFENFERAAYPFVRWRAKDELLPPTPPLPSGWLQNLGKSRGWLECGGEFSLTSDEASEFRRRSKCLAVHRAALEMSANSKVDLTKKKVPKSNMTIQEVLDSEVAGIVEGYELRLVVSNDVYEVAGMPSEVMLFINDERVSPIYEPKAYAYDFLYGYDVGRYAKSGRNTFQVCVREPLPASTRFQLRIVERRSMSQIAESILVSNTMCIATAREQLRSLFEADSGVQLVSSSDASQSGGAIDCPSYTCNTYDPVTMETITTPVRFKACDHFQCFDLKSALGMAVSMRARIECSVCMRRGNVDDLVCDSYFAHLGNSANAKNASSFIVTPKNLHTAKTASFSVVFVQDDDDDDESSDDE